MVLHTGDALPRTAKSDATHGCGASLFAVVPGIPKGAASHLWHTTFARKSSVLCLPPRLA